MKEESDTRDTNSAVAMTYATCIYINFLFENKDNLVWSVIILMLYILFKLMLYIYKYNYTQKLASSTCKLKIYIIKYYLISMIRTGWNIFLIPDDAYS